MLCLPLDMVRIRCLDLEAAASWEVEGSQPGGRPSP